MTGSWKGWEYETSNGLHMFVSKRHYFLDDTQAVCGARPPKHIDAHKDAGDYACRKCSTIVDKLEAETGISPVSLDKGLMRQKCIKRK